MKLSSRVLLLWGVRIFLLPLPFTPLLEKGFGSKTVLWLSYFIITSVIFCIFYIKYKTCTITLSSAGISLSSGFFIRKHLYIKHRHILAATKVYTPLSKVLGICNLVLYCEGSTFVFPPLEKELAAHIEAETKKPEDTHEA